MTRPRYSTVLPYLGAVAIVATATLLRLVSDPLLQDRQPFAAFLVAVIVTARYCGLTPSLLALLLSALASRYFFMSPRGSLVISGPDQQASFAFYLLFGLFFAFLMRSEQRAKQALQREIDERKRIEAELRASQDRFHVFVDNGPFAAFMKDHDGKYVYVNKCVERSSLSEAKKWLGKTDCELFSSEEAKQCVQDDLRVMQGNTTVHFNDTTTWPDGTVQHWSTIKFPLQDGQGRQLLGGIAVDVTETRKAEQLAKDSEVRLLLALEAGRLGIWSWDMNTNRVQSSETQAVISGRSSDQTDTSLEESIRNIHPDDQGMLQDVMEQIFKNQAPAGMTYRVVWPDGSIHWIESSGRVFCDESGKPNRVMGVCADITERKHAEDALRASEERFRLLAMHAPVGIAQSDAEGRTFFVNSKWCEIAGATPEESMAYGWQDFLHPEDRGRLIETWQADMAAGKTHSTSEFRFIRKDGSIRWASSTASQISDSSGKPIGQIGVTEDITERRQAEIALKKAEERFRVLATQAPVGIFQADSQGRNTFVNQRWSDITGLTAEETFIEGWKRAVHLDDLSRVENEWAVCVREGREWKDELRLVNMDGGIRWVMARATAISGSQGGDIQATSVRSWT